ncbi:MAG TPA: DUF3786 domain-containing protein [Spirochaetia bacterium]|nr:DUF3786 domain-containing protein [Spirochaetia bacterium]
MAWMNLAPAMAGAREAFAGRDPGEMARNSGTVYDGCGVLSVPFLGTTYKVSYPEGVFVAEGPEPDLGSQILILHYLTGATGLVPGGRQVSFKELPSGFLYAGPFAGRAVQPLTRAFGEAGGALLAAGAALGGRSVQLGDVAVELPALPLVPLTLIIWLGDEEFPAGGNILFDATAPVHLSTEDCVVLAETAVRRLRAVKS